MVACWKDYGTDYTDIKWKYMKWKFCSFSILATPPHPQAFLFSTANKVMVSNVILILTLFCSNPCNNSHFLYVKATQSMFLMAYEPAVLLAKEALKALGGAPRTLPYHLVSKAHQSRNPNPCGHQDPWGERKAKSVAFLCTSLFKDDHQNPVQSRSGWKSISFHPVTSLSPHIVLSVESCCVAPVAGATHCGAVLCSSQPLGISREWSPCYKIRVHDWFWWGSCSRLHTSQCILTWFKKGESLLGPILEGQSRTRIKMMLLIIKHSAHTIKKKKENGI